MTDPIEATIRRSLADSAQRNMASTFAGTIEITVGQTQYDDIMAVLDNLPPAPPNTLKMSEETWMQIEARLKPLLEPAPPFGASMRVQITEHLPLGFVAVGWAMPHGFKLDQILDLRSPEVQP